MRERQWQINSDYFIRSHSFTWYSASSLSSLAVYSTIHPGTMYLQIQGDWVCHVLSEMLNILYKTL